MCLFKRNKSSLNNKNITSTFAEGGSNEPEIVLITTFAPLGGGVTLVLAGF